MANPDVSAIASSFVQFGGDVFRKHVVNWDLRSKGIQVRTNVNAPQVLTKLSAVGGPRPYRSADDTSGNGVKFTDRTLTVYQSKWDHDFDAEEFRNTYLADAAFSSDSFLSAANNQIAKEYLAAINNTTLGLGIHNASGTGAVDLCDGWLTIIAALITATTLTPNSSVGAITSSNAVEAVETLVEETVPTWAREQGFIMKCSYDVLDKYRKAYRSNYGFTFDKNVEGKYKLDNLNCELVANSWMGTSQRLIATIPNNLVFGTNTEAIQISATARRNIVEVRAMMPVGCQIQDTDAIWVNDQA